MSAPASNNGRPRHRHNELATAPPILSLLGHDFVLEVPWQDEHVVRLLGEHAVWRGDWQTYTGDESTLFVRIAIDHKIQGLLSNAHVVEHDGSLGCRAVADDARLA